MLIITALALAGAATAPEPTLDMMAFFTGHTRSENSLKVVMKPASRMVVESVGGRGDRGDFVLIDTVREEGKPARTRKWIMKLSGPNHYTGTLTDAVGPVDVSANGRTATIRYTMKGGLKVTQQLELLGDGKTLANRVVVKKFGMKFASVDGKIRKLD